jgi:hypothetical protein
MAGFKKLAICTERRTRVIDAFTALANAVIIIRRLVRTADQPPLGQQTHTTTVTYWRGLLRARARAQPSQVEDGLKLGVW